MLKNISIYPAVLAISTGLTLSSVSAMKDDKDFFNFAKAFGQQPKQNKQDKEVKNNQNNTNKQEIEKNTNKENVDFKKLYADDNINVSHLSDQKRIKIAYIASNFVAKHNDYALKQFEENALDNLIMTKIFLGRYIDSTNGLSWEDIESQYSKERKCIDLDHYKTFRIKFSISQNKVYTFFNRESAQNYPLVQVIVRNLEGDKDELVSKAHSMYRGFLNSKIKNNAKGEYSEEEAQTFYKLEKEIYGDKKN